MFRPSLAALRFALAATMAFEAGSVTGPGSSTGEVSAPTPTAWQLPEPEADEVVLKQNVEMALKWFKTSVVETWGGPAQYLQVKLAEKSAQEAFLNFLWDKFPFKDDHLYNLEQPLPPVQADALGDSTACKVHVAMLAFSNKASLKPFPSGHAALLLAETILHEGFRTGDEPLHVKHMPAAAVKGEELPSPWAASAAGMPLPPFTLAFVKGFLRASTGLALLHLFYETGQDFLTLFPCLGETFSTVYVHHVSHATVQEEVFHNFKVSLRNSIRRPPNMLTWIGTLQSLKHCGYFDSAGVIAKFNAGVAKSFQLVGSKATAIGNLMAQYPPELLDLLQQHVSKYGWENSALSDDNLSTKKVLPSFTFKAPHKSWKKFASMSVEASWLTWRRVFADFAKNSAGRKPDKSIVEGVAETAALLVNMANLLQESCPLKDEDKQAWILEKWVHGHVGLDVELAEVQAEKRETLAVTELKFFRALLDELKCKQPVNNQAAEQLQLTQLQADKFELTLKQINYDRQAFRVYKGKVSSYETHVHLAKVEWKQKAREEANSWARNWVKSKAHTFSYDEKKKGDLITKMHEHLATLLKAASLERENVAPCLTHLLFFGCWWVSRRVFFEALPKSSARKPSKSLRDANPLHTPLSRAHGRTPALQRVY